MGASVGVVKPSLLDTLKEAAPCWEHTVPPPIAAAVSMDTEREDEDEGERRREEEEKLPKMSRMASVTAVKQDCRQ